MFEKVNPSHPDKVADRIAGALVDYCYSREESPKCAFEVLIGHGKCHIMGECSVRVPWKKAKEIAERIAGKGIRVYYDVKPQDGHLAANQSYGARCGDNGIFKGAPTTPQQQALSAFARTLYEEYPTDGKFVLADGEMIVCQSNAGEELDDRCEEIAGRIGIGIDGPICCNPLGEWTGGTDVDTGATNRKLGSDMGDAVTGGGLHGKDLTKADVAVNVWLHLEAKRTGEIKTAHCAIGDDRIDGIAYEDIIEEAKGYIDSIGGFEKLAEWGLIR